MSVAVRRVSLLVYALVLLAGAGVLGIASASAETIHRPEFDFNGHEAPNGGASFNYLGATAVDQVNGDVWIVEWETGVIYKFDAAGGYAGVEITGTSVPQGSLGVSSVSGIAVDDSGGPNNEDLYVASPEHGVVYKFDDSGKLLSEINGSGTLAGSFTPTGVAVDDAGDLYVADSLNAVIDRFDASGVFLSQIASPKIFEPGVIAVDSSGDVYVTTGRGSEGGSIPTAGSTIKLEPGGGTSVLDANKTLTVAVDPANNHVYVSEVEAYKYIEEVIPGSFQTREIPFGRVVEYDPSGNRLGVFGEEIVNQRHEFPETFGLAVDGSTGEVYAADFNKNIIEVFGPAIVVLEAKTGAGSNVHQSSATLNGTVNPQGLPLTDCEFEYGASTSYGQSVPCQHEGSQSLSFIGTGTSPVPVSADLSGLPPDTTYHFRLIASSAIYTSRGSDATVTTTGPPRLNGEYATDVATTSATLNANVDPLWPTPAEYRLEYGTSTTYGHTVIGKAGEDAGDVLVSYHGQEFLPDTTYHYRFVTTNIYGTLEGADHTFTTQPVEGEELMLPDGRAWELVSPPNKNGALIETSEVGNDIQAANNGSAITYVTQGPSVGETPMGNFVVSRVLSKRDHGGWETEDIVLPRVIPKKGDEEAKNLYYAGIEEYRLFSADLSSSIVEPNEDTPPLTPEATERTLYLRNDANGSLSSLVSAANVPEGTQFGSAPEVAGGIIPAKGIHFLAATPDLSHVVLYSTAALTPEAISDIKRGAGACPNGTECGTSNLYEWNGGQLHLVNILPNGEATRGKSAWLGGTESYGGAATRAISNDGSEVVWTVGGPYPPTIHQEPYEGLFVRDMPEEKTLKIGGRDPLFQMISGDGSKIFFRENGDLYVFDVGSGTQTDLTTDHGTGEADGGVEEAVLGASEDGSYVYFVATSVLADGAISGEDNLYVSHDNDGAWTTTFIATLSSEDEPDWFAKAGDSTEDSVYLARVSSRVSPDGRYLAFMSNRSLTGYDNVDAVSGQPDEEVYLYGAGADHLVCASCDPTGARPVGVRDHQNDLLVDRSEAWSKGAELNVVDERWLAGSIPDWSTFPNKVVGYQPRYLSDNGRLFFDSPDALVPQATNGLEDVYEYEPSGEGSCTSASSTFSKRSQGCVGLISAGTSNGESAFFDASESGDDVFFITSSRLTPNDYDRGYDVYDAHLCSTEAPCVSSPVPSPPCTSGDSCKAAPSPQPEIFGSAPSATFSGVGNVINEVKPTPKTKAKVRPKKKRKTARKTRRKKANRRTKTTRSRATKTNKKGGR